MPTMTNSKIKQKCSISFPKRNFKPTVKYSKYEADFRKAGHWKENHSISKAAMYAFAGITATIPIVLTHQQCSDIKNGIHRFVQMLRDRMAYDGLYIAKRGMEYYVFKRSDNIEAVKMRNRKNRKSCQRNDILITNTPVLDFPKRTAFLADNANLITDLTVWS